MTNKNFITNNKYDIVYLIGGGIGNIIEALYSIEHCIKQNISLLIILESCSPSFYNYLYKCYGEIFINLQHSNINKLNTNILIHSWLFTKNINIKYDNYYYINADSISSEYYSETELFLSVTKGIYPDNYSSNILEFLKSEESKDIKIHNLDKKTIIYPGCSANDPSRRWPHYYELIQEIGIENCIILGGSDDLDFSMSYVYPEFLSKVLDQRLLNKKYFWSLCKHIGLLKKHSHLDYLEDIQHSYFNCFSWTELCYLFKHCKSFIGNDGGLSHFASASGSKGIVIFGPTSSKKSKPYNSDINSIFLNYDCQPCCFSKESIYLYKATNFINCPYQVKCLRDLDPKFIYNILSELG